MVTKITKSWTKNQPVKRVQDGWPGHLARNNQRLMKRETYQSLRSQSDRMCRGQFLKDGLKNQNAIYRDSSTAQAEFNSKNRSKICSLYEIFQHKGTVPNDQNDPFRVVYVLQPIATNYNQL